MNLQQVKFFLFQDYIEEAIKRAEFFNPELNKKIASLILLVEVMEDLIDNRAQIPSPQSIYKMERLFIEVREGVYELMEAEFFY